ncbi:unnamed protein product [Cuscuta campestris]|uniref:Uncharacterized protein n=1 Tax=Cuscuta campestris TaxID=132261 RepID=A0A484LW04_9ASTE|nr:unnamed protein product [Cuscuta campestris]
MAKKKGRPKKANGSGNTQGENRESPNNNNIVQNLKNTCKDSPETSGSELNDENPKTTPEENGVQEKDLKEQSPKSYAEANLKNTCKDSPETSGSELNDENPKTTPEENGVQEKDLKEQSPKSYAEAVGFPELIELDLKFVQSEEVNGIQVAKFTKDDVVEQSRNFLWGASPMYRKCPLVAWDEVCQPKRNGGLGLINLIHWNKACAMQLIWDIANKKDILWVQELKEIEEMLARCKSKERNLRAATFNACCYANWRVRNQIIHGKEAMSTGKCIDYIKYHVAIYILPKNR